MPSSRYVIALDQDTVFTHCSVFDHDGNLMATTERDHRQILPAPGYRGFTLLARLVSNS